MVLIHGRCHSNTTTLTRATLRRRNIITGYTDSIKKYQKYSVSTQASLSLLNGSQQLIIQTCAATCLCFAAYAVGDKTQSFSVGDFSAVNVYILNLFAPLSFLGTIYGAVIQAAVDMTNLSELLAEEPDVEDEEGAVDLTCDRAAGVDVVFEDVFFRYPSQAMHAHGLIINCRTPTNHCMEDFMVF